MNNERIEELKRALLDGRITDAELEELDRFLDTAPELAEEIKAQVALDTLIRVRTGCFTKGASLKNLERTIQAYEWRQGSVADRHQGEDFREEFEKQMRKVPWFAISAAIHGLMLVLFGLIVVRPVERAQAMIEVKSEIVTKEEEALIDEPERAEVEQPKDLPPIDPNVTAEVLVKDNMELDDVTEVETDSDDDVAVGEPDNMLVSEVAGPPGMFDVMGAGGGGGGGFGQRGRGGRQTRVRGGGGGRRTESAVNSALEWLARHQEADGHWDTGKHGGLSAADGDIGVSALACLAFLGAGHSPNTKSKYQATIKRGIEWLIKAQRPDGSFCTVEKGRGARADGLSPRENYRNATAAMAICEAFGMGCYEAQEPAKRAVDYLIAAQRPEGGWDYLHANGKPGRNDQSIGGWCIMALKSAYLAGVNFDQKAVWEKFRKYLQKSIRVTEGDSYNVTTEVCYDFDETKDIWRPSVRSQKVGGGFDGIAMSGAALLMYIYSGKNQNDPVLISLAERIARSGIASGANRNAYDIYYTTLAMFLTGAKGKYWRDFNATSGPNLLQTQRRGDPSIDGSWDPVSGSDLLGGRVYTTALKCMCLEVYYRYASVYNDLGKDNQIK